MSRNYTTHGLCTGGKPPLYYVWQAIKTRCGSPHHKQFADYGGRGINLFPSWRASFEEFNAYVQQELGPRPLKHSLDRIDNGAGYLPGNLRWATPKEQAANRRIKRLDQFSDAELLAECKRRGFVF